MRCSGNGNRNEGQPAIALLDLKLGYRGLGVGTGSGAALGKLATLTGREYAVGVDHSPVKCARRRILRVRFIVGKGVLPGNRLA